MDWLHDIAWKKEQVLEEEWKRLDYPKPKVV